jgi:hypothetical protein
VTTQSAEASGDAMSEPGDEWIGEDGRKRIRPRCGARTRAGAPCQAPGNGKGGRCKLHGGKSTGPRTHDGRRRISMIQQERWRKYRAARDQPS